MRAIAGMARSYKGAPVRGLTCFRCYALLRPAANLTIPYPTRNSAQSG